MTKMRSSRERGRLTELLANSQEICFFLLQKRAEGVLGEKINLVKTGFSAHKQTPNGRLYKKLKLQSHNGNPKASCF